MGQATTDGGARHPIGVVSGRTGLPQDVLRAWERRYAAVVPHRTETGRRLYTDADLEKLRLLSQAVASGRRISDVAPLTIDELTELIREDREASAARPRGPAAQGTAATTSGSASEFVERALAAALELDSRTLEAVLADASVELSAASLRREVIQPLLERVGDGWRAGEFRIAHEHLASAVVRSFLGSQRQGQDAPPGAPVVVVTTPAGQQHELGAMLVAIAALEIGWEAIYLGPNLPATEIAAVARQKGAVAVALSVISPVAETHLGTELRELRRLVGRGMAIFVGGAAAPVGGDLLQEVGARSIDDPAGFQHALESLGR